MATTPTFVAACWTTAGATDPGDDASVSPERIETRVVAAAAAGFTGFAIRHSDLALTEAEIGFAGFRRLLDEHGMRVLELEFLDDWYLPAGPRREASDRKRALLLRAAGELGAARIKVGATMGDGTVDMDCAAAELARLGAEAARAGTRIGVEPMPYTEFSTPQIAADVIRRARQPNVGLYLDVWHVARAGVQYESLREFPPSMIEAVELDDALAEPVGSLWNDTLNNRLLPGNGDLDVAGYVRVLLDAGYTGPFSVEILSAEYRKLPIGAAAAAAFKAAESVVRIAAETKGTHR
jgi:sugar phosphate isomerase/epimerase